MMHAIAASLDTQRIRSRFVGGLRAFPLCDGDDDPLDDGVKHNGVDFPSLPCCGTLPTFRNTFCTPPLHGYLFPVCLPWLMNDV